jgi:hypothetical protein
VPFARVEDLAQYAALVLIRHNQTNRAAQPFGQSPHQGSEAENDDEVKDGPRDGEQQ